MASPRLGSSSTGTKSNKTHSEIRRAFAQGSADAIPSSVEALEAEIDRLANDQFETPEFHDLFSQTFTLPRARVLTINMAHYVRNRRDCWGYVQGSAPLDVKRLIWHHEAEELVNDPRAGTDHYGLATREARALGLTPEDIETAETLPGAFASFSAWTHLARSSSWLEAFSASSVLEKRNSNAVVKGGGHSARVRRKFIDELGIPEHELINLNVHVEADVEHANLFRDVADRYALTHEDRQAMLRGAQRSFLIDRAFRGAMAQAMARV